MVLVAFERLSAEFNNFKIGKARRYAGFTVKIIPVVI